MATRSLPVRRPTVLSRSMPQRPPAVVRRPSRPRVIEYSARCMIHIVRTSQRGTVMGFLFVSDTAGLLIHYVYIVDYGVNIRRVPTLVNVVIKEGAQLERRRPLTRERVLEAAIELADRRGIEALSMRRLG